MDAKHERNAEIFRAIEAGETYASVARRFGLSPERIRQVHVHIHVRGLAPAGIPPKIGKAYGLG